MLRYWIISKVNSSRLSTTLLEGRLYRGVLGHTISQFFVMFLALNKKPTLRELSILNDSENFCFNSSMLLSMRILSSDISRICRLYISSFLLEAYFSSLFSFFPFATVLTSSPIFALSLGQRSLSFALFSLPFEVELDENRLAKLAMAPDF